MPKITRHEGASHEGVLPGPTVKEDKPWDGTNSETSSRKPTKTQSEKEPKNPSPAPTTVSRSAPARTAGSTARTTVGNPPRKR